MAAELKRSLGVDSTLIEGNKGEFTVWVGPRKVADKVNGEFPREQDVVNAVRSALGNATA